MKDIATSGNGENNSNENIAGNGENNSNENIAVNDVISGNKTIGENGTVSGNEAGTILENQTMTETAGYITEDEIKAEIPYLTEISLTLIFGLFFVAGIILEKTFSRRM